MFMKTSSAAAPAPASAAPSMIEPPAGDPADDPIPAAVHAVIDLFTTQLAKISFPDIDAAALRRQADELRAAAAAVTRARAALDAALASCAERAGALGDTARRAVAYAQIYSTAHPERRDLAAAIAALSAPVAVTSPAAPIKRRGRPPRRSAELFDAAAPPGALSEADPL
jgi:hypothetical protein